MKLPGGGAVSIRTERPDDIPTIAAITTLAFNGAPHAGGNEATIVGALRDAGALTLSLVATVSAEVVGHVALSPVDIGGAAGWFGLGPISVHPGWQRRGIGGALIAGGLGRLRDMGADGVVVLGDPLYYSRFGFEHYRAVTFPGAPAEAFRLYRYSDAPPPTGAARYHRAFG